MSVAITSVNDVEEIEDASGVQDGVVDRMVSALAPVSLDLALPWSPSQHQEERFKKILIACLLAILLLLIVLTFAPVGERQQQEKEEIESTTKVILKPVTIKPPEPEVIKPKPKPIPVEKPKVNKEKTLSRSPKPTDKPKEKVKSDGLAAVSSQLSALRNSFDLTRNKKKNLSDSQAGKKEKTSRSLLGKDNATKKSGGVKVDTDIMLDERTTLAAHNTASVQGIDQGGVEGGSPVSRYATHISSERTMESIRFTLEKNKGSIFSLYHQALNDNPKLSGKYTFELRIEPDGRISSLKLLSSQLEDKRLDNDILSRIRRIRFAAQDVIAARVTYTYTFIEN